LPINYSDLVPLLEEKHQETILQQVNQELTQKAMFSVIEPSLNDEAKELLIEAAKDKTGYIMKIRTTGGTAIQTNGKNLIPDQTPRIVAKWEHALNELYEAEFIEDRGHEGESFKVTHKGYNYAEKLQDKQLANKE